METLVKELDYTAYKTVSFSSIEIDGVVYDIEIRECLDKTLFFNLSNLKLKHYVTINGMHLIRDSRILALESSSISHIFLTKSECACIIDYYVARMDAYKKYITIARDPKSLKYFGKKEDANKKALEIKKEMEYYNE